MSCVRYLELKTQLLKASFKDDDPGKECVICLTEPKDTAVLPCRHMVRIYLEITTPPLLLVLYPNL